jgi:PAS domain-containing protein
MGPVLSEKRPVLADLVIDNSPDKIDEYYANFSSNNMMEGCLKAEGWFENIGGRRLYIFFDAAPIRNSRNEIIAAIETLEDITERKLAEEATASYSLFLREVLDAIPDPVYYKNSNGVYLGCNTAFKNFFGKTEEEIIGRTP